MKGSYLPLIVLACLHPAALLADGIKGARGSYRGVWAGERMPCTDPDSRLHLYGAAHVRHPAIRDDDTGLACEVTRIEGRRPDWTLHLRCTTFGIGQKPVRLDATQTLALREGGTRLAVDMKAKRGDVAWSDVLLRCRPVRAR
jgi:hypothetical protein